jgi:hypothetical protein
MSDKALFFEHSNQLNRLTKSKSQSILSQDTSFYSISGLIGTNKCRKNEKVNCNLDFGPVDTQIVLPILGTFIFKVQF